MRRRVLKIRDVTVDRARSISQASTGKVDVGIMKSDGSSGDRIAHPLKVQEVQGSNRSSELNFGNPTVASRIYIVKLCLLPLYFLSS